MRLVQEIRPRLLKKCVSSEVAVILLARRTFRQRLAPLYSLGIASRPEKFSGQEVILNRVYTARQDEARLLSEQRTISRTKRNF